MMRKQTDRKYGARVLVSSVLLLALCCCSARDDGKVELPQTIKITIEGDSQMKLSGGIIEVKDFENVFMERYHDLIGSGMPFEVEIALAPDIKMAEVTQVVMVLKKTNVKKIRYVVHDDTGHRSI